MTVRTRGLIIREHYTGENDRIVAILTPTGIVRAFAMGSRKIINTNLGATQLLCFSEFELVKGRDTYKVTSAKSIDIFYELRQDISRICLAQYFCEAVSFFSAENDDCNETLRLILNCLKFLCDPKKDEKLIKAVFELRMMCIQGYMPHLDGCIDCQKTKGDFYFSNLDGGIFCENCAPSKHLPLSLPAIMAARHICYSPFDKIFKFKLAKQHLPLLCSMTEKFICTQAEIKFGTLEFYNSIQEKL